MSTSSEKRLLEAARRCDGAAIEEIVAGGKTNLDAVDQVGINFRDRKNDHLVDYPIRFDTVIKLPILYFKGSPVEISTHHRGFAAS